MQNTILKNDEMLINMGPHHPATHGVLRLKLKKFVNIKLHE